jgi:hypothetical protein
MNSPNKGSARTRIVWLHNTSAPAYFIFDPNDWTGSSKPIVMSCAAQCGLLWYQASKIPALVQNAERLCESRFLKLQRQWEKAPWDIEKPYYLVEVPEFHLYVQAYLATIKTFLDLLVQLISTEGIVDKSIHGFHKKGNQIGGQLLHILKTRARTMKENTAHQLHRLIEEQKTVWIDQAVNIRDVLVHPEEGMSQVMFRLEIGLDNGNLKLLKILQPSVNGQPFDKYTQTTLQHIEHFSKRFLDIMKAA